MTTRSAWRCMLRLARLLGIVFLPALGLAAIFSIVFRPADGGLFPMAFAAETDDPSYPHGDYDGSCAMCHGPEGWVPAVISDGFDHGESGFPLDGAHNSTPCRACHVSLEFSKVRSTCGECHQDVHRGELGIDCAMCHTTRNFIDRAAEVRMHRMTRFPLAGAHATVDCDACHAPGADGSVGYVNTSAECESCHLDDYMTTTDPDHTEMGFAQDCQLCHSVVVWQGAEGFDHGMTALPLTGAHVAASCTQCHTSGSFEAIPSDCHSCHAGDYQQAPGHVSGNFPTSCEQCHSTLTWAGAAFNHDFFPFVGGHSGLECQQCHTGGTTGPIPADCFSCHQPDYQQAPGHVSSGLPTTCEDCHTVMAWPDVTIDHGSFPLTGGHNAVSCLQCHTTGTFGPIPSDCVVCHQSDYDQALGHVSSGFPTSCEDCHTVTAWPNATFGHDFFPLSGGHGSVTCLQCHTSGTYNPIPSDCYSCHQSDYDQALGHVSSGFPTSCEDCHTVTVWPNATFTHDFFPLSGGHNGIACVACHTTGNFDPIPADCYSCHQSDYQTGPDHQDLNFPLDCESCHNIMNWQDVNFDHSPFNVNSGHHHRPCAECHTEGTTSTFSCLGSCHHHTQSDMDGEHSGVSGYVYDFIQCFACHPTGN